MSIARLELTVLKFAAGQDVLSAFQLAVVNLPATAYSPTFLILRGVEGLSMINLAQHASPGDYIFEVQQVMSLHTIRT